MRASYIPDFAHGEIDERKRRLAPGSKYCPGHAAQVQSFMQSSLPRGGVRFQHARKFLEGSSSHV
jgi:hypothetical protein